MIQELHNQYKSYTIEGETGSCFCSIVRLILNHAAMVSTVGGFS